MKIRPLVIDEAIKAKAAQVIEYASAHPYRPVFVGGNVDPSTIPPGDDQEHCLRVPMGYLCVFSFTEIAHEGRYRDLSVSVPTPGKYPQPFALFTLATELFGFTGWDGYTTTPLPEGWMVDMDRTGRAVRVVQRMEHLG